MPSWWLNEPDEVVMTAVDLLNEANEASRG
jgi:hypothetical protein